MVVYKVVALRFVLFKLVQASVKIVCTFSRVKRKIVDRGVGFITIKTAIDSRKGTRRTSV